jgi:recombination protein RecA
MTSQEEKKKLEALKAVVMQIERQHGKGAIMRLGEATRLEIEGIPTGSLSLDIALGGKGIPRGRVVEVFGPEGSGKTTLCLSIVANAQRRHGIAAYIDAEHAVDPIYAEKIGVNIKELLLSQPDSGEQALDIAEMLVRSNSVDVIIIDSVAALVPKAELEGEIGDLQVGLQARIMSQALRKLCGVISKSKTSVIFINQLRERIGAGTFANPETTPGGRALKFYSSIRIDLRRMGTIKEADQGIGTRIKAKIVKNKVAPPFKTAEFDLLFASGISYEGDLLSLGEELGILSRQGTWFTYKSEKIGQGREKARHFLLEHKDIAKKLEDEIKERLLKTE